MVTSHLISTIWPIRPHKPYIFWKLMTRPNQITSSSVIHQLPISSSLVVTNNDDIVQNLIQFLVQNSHSLLLSSFTNNYIVGSWTFNPPKCKTPLFFKYLCNHPFDLRYHLFLFYFWAAKRERNSSFLRSRKFVASGIMTARWIVIKIIIFSPSHSPILDTLSDFQPLVALLSNSCVFNDPPSMLLSPQKNVPKSP